MEYVIDGIVPISAILILFLFLPLLKTCSNLLKVI